MMMKENAEEMPDLRCEGREKRRKREVELYADFRRLVSEDPERSRTKVHEYLREKYGLKSYSSTYEIIRRVEKRLAIAGSDERKGGEA